MISQALLSTIAQAYLLSLGFYRAAVDGVWGPKSIAAASHWWAASEQYIRSRLAQPRMGVFPVQFRIIAAQIHLTDLGLYHGHIDGEWGPLSQAAAAGWQFPTPADKPSLSLTPYDVARRHLGVREIPGKQHNPTILNWYRKLIVSVYDDETAWCSTFVNFCALEAGYERTGKLNARSWLHIGERITTRQARQGDVIIFERGNSVWQGHVAFIQSINLETGRAVCLGGNQNDAVNLQSYPLSKLLGIRRLRSLETLQGGSNKI